MKVKIVDDTLKKVDKSVIICGLICLTALELTALALGFNGTLLKAVMVVIALAIGIVIPKPKSLRV